MSTPTTEQPTKVAVFTRDDRVDHVADRWELGENGHLFVRLGDDEVAVYAPGHWLSIQRA